MMKSHALDVKFFFFFRIKNVIVSMVGINHSISNLDTLFIAAICVLACCQSFVNFFAVPCQCHRPQHGLDCNEIKIKRYSTPGADPEASKGR
jgi:hypothetical protein